MNKSSVQFTTLADGTLSPDARVNYQYGLVLGVNEFRQEQQYFLGRDYLHNNELHGSGIVSGLHVTADPYPSSDSPNDVQVTIKPGMAIDQQGKTLIVRKDQCARLGAWLAQQIRDDPDTLKKHPPDDNGVMSVYIVASYAEEQEQPVPVAGSLSNNGDTTYARISDAFDIEFSWLPPHMPTWDAVREFAALLGRLHVVPGIRGDSDDDDSKRIEALIAAICRHVRRIGRHHHHHGGDAANAEALEQERWSEGEAEKGWYLPEYVVQDALDRIFTVWVTEVRPHLSPNLIDGKTTITDQQAGILLGRIDFVPDDPFLVNKPRILKFTAPDTNGCPFLLSSQVLQELITLGGRDAQPPYEFATLQTLDNRTLQVWIHHPAPIIYAPDIDDWNEILQLKSDGQLLTIDEVVAVNLPNAGNVFEIHIDADDDDPMLLPGSRVELTFKLEHFPLRVEGEEEVGERPHKEDSGLVAGVEDIGEGAERGAKDILKGRIVEGAESAVEGTLHGAEDVVEGAFKGAEDIVKDVAKGVEDAVGGVGKGVKDAVQGKLARGAEDVVKGAVEGVEDVVKGGVTGVEDVLGTPTGKEREQRRGRKHKRSLGDSIDDLGIDYVGYDRITGTITVYAIAAHWSSRELVTLYVFNPDTTSVSSQHPASGLAAAVGAETTLHLWFHTESPVKLPESCQVLVPRSYTDPPEAMTFAAVPPPGTTYSYFWALVPPAEFPLQPGELLTVTLDTDQVLVQSTGGDGTSGGGDDITDTGAAGESADVTNTGAAGESADVTNTGAAGESADVTNTGAAGESADVTNTGAAGESADITNTGSNDGDSGQNGDNGDNGDGDDNGALTLTDVLKYLPYRFAGYDGDHTIIAHHQVPSLTPTIVEAGEKDGGRERPGRPTMPFVTITHIAEREGGGEGETEERFELWFHLISDPTDEIASLNERISCELFAEFSDLRRSGRVEITDISPLQLNVFALSTTLPPPPDNQQAYYLRFKFSLNANPVRIRRGATFQNLGEYMQSSGINFEGFNGRDAIVAYARIPVRRRG